MPLVKRNPPGCQIDKDNFGRFKAIGHDAGQFALQRVPTEWTQSSQTRLARRPVREWRR